MILLLLFPRPFLTCFQKLQRLQLINELSQKKRKIEMRPSFWVDLFPFILHTPWFTIWKEREREILRLDKAMCV